MSQKMGIGGKPVGSGETSQKIGIGGSAVGSSAVGIKTTKKRMGIGGKIIASGETSKKMGIGGRVVGSDDDKVADTMKKMGIGGKPVGKGTFGREPKQSLPCSDFQNTQNKEICHNTEKFFNTEEALNTEQPINFQCSDDILEILQSHPDFFHVPPENLGAIGAAIASALALAGGITLTIVTGGLATASATPCITAILKVAGAAALTSAGSAGLKNAVQHGMRGTFTWTTWSQEVALAAGTTLIVLPATLATGHLAGGMATRTILVQEAVCRSEEAASMIIHRSIVAATSLVNSVGEGGSSLARQLIREGKVDSLALIVSLVVGVWSGYSIGQTISNLRMRELIQETLLKLNTCFRERQGITTGMVDGLLNNGDLRSHAVEKHGPDADIAGRMQNTGPGIRLPPSASRFRSMEDQVKFTHKAVSEGTSGYEHVLEDGGVKLVFDYKPGENGEDLLIDYVLKKNATVVHEGEAGSLVRAVVILKDGQRPVIVTSYPKF